MNRVLITSDTVGGIWQYTIELAAGLKRLGVEPIIAALGAPSPPGFLSIGNCSVFFFPCRLEWMQDPWEDVKRSGDWLLRLADHLKPDLVHINGYAHAARNFPVPVLVVGHSCVYSWYQAVRGRPPSARWEHYRQAVADGLKAARGVTAPTAAMLSSLAHHYGTFRRLEPIANGRRSASFPPAAKETLIFSAGRLWDEAKNIATLTQVAGGLAWPVVVAGEQTHPDGGKVHFRNVRLLGVLTQQQIAAWFARAAIYALPALYEPFGLTALEAGLAGCALVLGDIPSMRETWEGAALFVPPRRNDLLEAALNRLIDDERLRRSFARKARQKALAFTTEKMVRRYAKLYGQLLGEEEKEIIPWQPKIA
ncbi:MAG: glycosyltransferase [Desulfobacteraceae bacterium]|nr:MAG: glycosyltransferase [Desulfobacteraceae bacterium]